jgi:hypothetical protein
VKVAFDTSVLVPAVVANHRHHARARCWLLAVETGRLEGIASWHAMTAEEAGADAMVTFNQADFARLTDTGSPRIVVPPDPPTVTL